jgi:hypothetical protein
MHEAFAELEAIPHEVHDLGDQLVALGEIHYRPRGADVEASAPIGWLLEFRGGLIVKGTVFMRHADALEAAGIDPAARTPTSTTLPTSS